MVYIFLIFSKISFPDSELGEGWVEEGGVVLVQVLLVLVGGGMSIIGTRLGQERGGANH